MIVKTFGLIVTLRNRLCQLVMMLGIVPLLTPFANASITVVDDGGSAVTLAKPAQRVISMAPHVTELLFAAGGGTHVVGVVSYSDYPEAAKRIQLIGDNNNIDMERVLSLKPDLIVVWRHGSSDKQVEQLRKLGFPMFFSEPDSLEKIPDSVSRLGKLLGTETEAERVASDLRNRLSAIKTQYAQRAPVRVFYQVWDRPLYTLNGKHIVSDALRTCGGVNIFADMSTIAPSVGIEAVLQADPDVVIGTAEKTPSAGGVNMWKAYPRMRAVRESNLFALNGDWLNRPGPRMLDGTAQLCAALEQARSHRSKSGEQAPKS